MGVLIFPYIRSGMPCLHGGKLFLPLSGKLLSRIAADLTDIGEAITPFVGPGCLNDHSRVMALLAGRNYGIEGTAPGTAQNINRGGRIRSSGYRPDDFVQIRDVDVLVDNHHIPAQIGTGMALASD